MCFDRQFGPRTFKFNRYIDEQVGKGTKDGVSDVRAPRLSWQVAALNRNSNGFGSIRSGRLAAEEV